MSPFIMVMFMDKKSDIADSIQVTLYNGDKFSLPRTLDPIYINPIISILNIQRQKDKPDGWEYYGHSLGNALTALIAISYCGATPKEQADLIRTRYEDIVKRKGDEAKVLLSQIGFTPDGKK